MSARKKTVSTEAEPITTVMVPDGETADVEPVAQEAAPEPKQEPEPVVYLGPNIGKFINHGAVYEGGVLPDYLQEKIEQIPAIKGLIVPVSRYSEVAKLITLPEGRYRTLYDLVEAKAK